MRKAKKIWTMSERDYLHFHSSWGGICYACGTIVDDRCEPDSRNYECDSCGRMEVPGMERALEDGRIAIKSSDQEKNP